MTSEKLDDGKARQSRTNVLVATTVGLGLATAVAMLLVDWRPSRGALRITPTIANGGGLIVVSAVSR